MTSGWVCSNFQQSQLKPLLKPTDTTSLQDYGNKSRHPTGVTSVPVPSIKDFRNF